MLPLTAGCARATVAIRQCTGLFVYSSSDGRVVGGERAGPVSLVGFLAFLAYFHLQKPQHITDVHRARGPARLPAIALVWSPYHRGRRAWRPVLSLPFRFPCSGLPSGFGCRSLPLLLSLDAFALLPFALIPLAVGRGISATTVPFVITPLALIAAAVSPCISATTVPAAVAILALIPPAVGRGISAPAIRLAVAILALMQIAVGHGISATTVPVAVAKLPCVAVTIRRPVTIIGTRSCAKLGTVQASELVRSFLRSERPSSLASAIMELVVRQSLITG